MSSAAKTSDFRRPPPGDELIQPSVLGPLSSASDSEQSTVNNQPSTALCVSLLTGGADKPYALGMAAALTTTGISVDFIGSDDLSVPELCNNRRINFLNLRGDQDPTSALFAKIWRVLRYYLRLVWYAAAAKPRLFHILWNNKFQFIDCIGLMLYYKVLGKKVVFTAHNVNAGKRDANDTWLNRFCLRTQYRLSDHIFVHSGRMKSELMADFHVHDAKVSVIPFGINNTVPNTTLTREEAKRSLGIHRGDKAILFFGNIAPYKGLEYLVSAFVKIRKKDPSYRLIIVGSPKGPEGYWERIRQSIDEIGAADRIVQKIEYVPDEETEVYFKAADVLVLPYSHVFQSGVLFLGYSFGLPAIATDVGPLQEEIIEGQTGYVCRPRDAADLATRIEQYFNSELYHNLESRRDEIKKYANERYSWDKVAAITTTVYSNLLAKH